MPRLFVATELNRAALDRAARLEDELRRALRRRARVRWTRPEGRHVTLAFLGQVPDERIEGIGEVLEKIALSYAPLEVQVRGLGAFPNERRARVVWLGVTDPAGALVKLATELQEALRGLGFDIDNREFRGHVTLGRLADRRGVDLGDVLDRDDENEPTVVSMDSLVLFESQLAPSGARYHRKRQVRLRAPG